MSDYVPAEELRGWSRDWLQEPAEDTEAIRVGTLLLAALFGGCGPNNKRLRAYTGVPWSTLNKASWWLREAQIWEPDGTMYYPWLDDIEEGNDAQATVGFALQCLVGEGAVVYNRSTNEYRARTMGDAWGQTGVGETRTQYIGRTTRKVRCNRHWRIPGGPHLVTPMVAT